jgi:hypothetical protein
MSDGVLVALIGVGGTIVGAVATILVARIQASRGGNALPPAEGAETAPVLGHAIDIRELRILRALFGEPKGRVLEAYQDSYYGPSLAAVIKKGWVKRIEKRYYMTTKGAEFCRAYLKELFSSWQPGAQVLA